MGLRAILPSAHRPARRPSQRGDFIGRLRGMRVIRTPLLLMVLAVAGCDLNEQDRRIRKACGDETGSEMYTRAIAGELDAIDCEITIADTVFLNAEYFERDANRSAAWRYLRWLVSGEQPADLLDIAAQADRADLGRRMTRLYVAHLTQTGAVFSADAERPHRALYDERGCFLRPPRMDRVWRAAIPNEIVAHCNDATGGRAEH